MVDPVDLVGAPFAYGGRGPDSFDCYGLVMHILKEKHGLVVPDFKSSADQALISARMAVGVQDWSPIEQQPGAVVLLRVGRYISHCGYMLDTRRMIHTWEDSGGVVIERLDAWGKRVAGFYRYVGPQK